MKKLAMLSVGLGLAGCASVVPTATTPTRPSMTNLSGLERVMGTSAEGLVAMFGEPAQDFREETARKLQFANADCVLDTYLYPATAGGEPVVTYVDARSPVGEDVDRAACVATLTRR